MDTHVSELHIDNMEPRSLEERVSFPCLRAEEVGCPKTFSSKGNAEKHAKGAHDEIRYPCPYAEEFDCDRTFSSKQNAEKHAREKHDEVKYACAVEGCDSVFTRKVSAEQHAKTAHVEKPTRKGIACPLRDDLGCFRMFSSPQRASKHVKAMHHKVKDVPCPFAEEEGCTKKFTKSHAKQHAESVHVGEPTYPCPPGKCDKMFKTPTTARIHAKKQHGVVEADKTFIAAWPKILPHMPLLDESGKQIPAWDKLPEPSVLDNRFTCPHPGCSKTNPDIGKIRNHYLSKHMRVRWPCKYVETLGCDQTFSSKGSAESHAKRHFPTRYWFICQFDRCLVHVQGRKISEPNSITHYKMHVQRGHFQKGECLPLKVRNNERTK